VMDIRFRYGNYYWDSDLQAIEYDNYPNRVCQINEVAIWMPDVIHCRPKPAATAAPAKQDVFPSPNRLWQARLADAIWLEKASGEKVGQAGSWLDGQVIWRPDSLGFFLVAKSDPGYALFYVSVPDLALSIVDDRVGEKIYYRWLEANGR
jgi:hypothetical protein